MRPLLAILLLTLVAGCDMLGIESPEKIAANREADGKAVGGACRHAGRAIEDCYALNRKADRAAVFAGWREMNDYMRENKIDEVEPQLGRVPARVASDDAEPDHDKIPQKGREAKAGTKARES
jgi:hypothetical protein